MTRCPRCDNYAHTCRDCSSATRAADSRLVAEVVVGLVVVVGVFLAAVVGVGR